MGLLIPAGVVLIFLIVSGTYAVRNTPEPTSLDGEPFMPNRGEGFATIFHPNGRRYTSQDQRAYISISVDAGVSYSEVKAILRRVFKTNAYSDNKINSLYNEFKRGDRESTERCPVSGRPTTATDDAHVDMLIDLMGESRTWTVDQLANEMGISVGSTATLLERCEFRKVGATFLPHELNSKQKENRVKMCQRNLARHRREHDLLDRIIAIDESWLRCYDPLTNQQSQEWRQPGENPPTRVVSELRDFKILMTTIIYQDQIIGVQYLERGETMNGDRYKSFLENVLKPLIQKKRIRNPIILQDHATPHERTDVQNYITGQGWEILDHPAWSPDLNPCDFDVFHRIKRPLKGKRFSTRNELIAAADESIKQINTDHSLIGIANLNGRWQEIIGLKGDYLIHNG